MSHLSLSGSLWVHLHRGLGPDGSNQAGLTPTNLYTVLGEMMGSS